MDRARVWLKRVLKHIRRVGPLRPHIIASCLAAKRWKAAVVAAAALVLRVWPAARHVL